MLMHNRSRVVSSYVWIMGVKNSAEAHESVSVSDIASLLLRRIDELADEMTAVIENAVTPYQQGVVDHETLRAASAMNIGAILGDLGRVNATASFELSLIHI